MPVKKWIRSANNAIEGILHASRTQRHLRYHFYVASAVLIASYVLGVTKTEFLIIALAAIAVLSAEMINSSVEAVVDILSPERNSNARTAKDMAAGAVLITAFGSAVVGYIILFPYLKKVLARGPYITKHPMEEVSIIAFILVLIVVVLLKAYYGKGHPLRGGMPSGHSALAFSVWVSVTYTSESFFASTLCLVLALIIARSRVVTGVHRVREVVFGAGLGALMTFVLFQVFA